MESIEPFRLKSQVNSGLVQNNEESASMWVAELNSSKKCSVESGPWSERGLLGIVFTGVALMWAGAGAGGGDMTAAAARGSGESWRVPAAVGAGGGSDGGAGVAALALSDSRAAALMAASSAV